MPASGKHVRLFLAEGTVGGLLTAEIMNWTGHVLRGRRDKLAQIRKRMEAQRTGVYILLGEDRAYIGQSDNVAGRIVHHDQKKDFWDEVVIITSKDANLTSAHVRYLESRLVRLASEIGRMPLDNGNVPSGGAELPEADVSDMEYFIEQMRVLLPVLGVNLLRGRAVTAPAAAEGEPMATTSPEFRLTARGADARAQIIDGEFTLLSGSVIPREMAEVRRHSDATARAYERTVAERTSLFESGAFRIEGDKAVVARDVVFQSPSGAARVAAGRVAVNGRAEWKLADGRAFRAWEESSQASA